jgi:hypothetical protein
MAALSGAGIRRGKAKPGSAVRPARRLAWMPWWMPFEVRVAELTPDGVERHALAGELLRVGGAQLMRREPSPEPAHGATRRNLARAAAP